jgi:murein L,D-transpeptidase YafK
MMSRLPGRLFTAAMLLGLVSACADPEFRGSNSRHWVPLTPQLMALMEQKGMSKDSPVLIRTYKQEAEFEVWKQDVHGRYALLKTFPMCRWSGQLGPKRKEGDRQAPEGYYAIAPAQMNPNSNYHLSYDMGYPNAYDRAHGGTGSYLMVHGDCSSAGCYSMTDQQIEEIYALVREAHSGGQKAVQMEAFPFRFTAANMARHRLDPNMQFWKNLKEGADRFEITKLEPKVGVCNGKYTFDRVAKNGEAAGCGAEGDADLAAQVAQKERDDTAQVAELIAKGTPAVKIAYEDGGQHPSFRNKIAETSRPEAIAEGPTVELYDAKGALTRRAVQAQGFDETSISAAITDVGKPETTPTAVASAAPTSAKGKASPASVMASAGAAPAAASPASAKPAGQTAMARRDASPPTSDGHLAFASTAEPAAPSPAASTNKEQPFYRKLFTALPSIPFIGGNGSEANAQPEAAASASPEQAAPVPPSRPSRQVRQASRGNGMQANLGQDDGQSSMQATPRRDGGPRATQANIGKNGSSRAGQQANLNKDAGAHSAKANARGNGAAAPSQTDLTKDGDQLSSSSGGSLAPGVDLFSAKPISANLSSFSKRAGASSKNNSAPAPAAPAADQ